MQLFMEDYAFIFVAAIITIALTIMLRAFGVTLIQAVVLGIPALINIEAMVSIMIIAQVLLTGVTLYKFIKALDLNYQITLEKTHQKQPDLIKEEHRGSRFSFWKTS
ncbi:hypothetical protein [Lentibacillus sp. CBA3610]|uniref:hypothetical protein n=1 Tax=Lentibacillus sp. CBA3610 TaxID=2518176 RepID=UPI0015950F64|nr:hypothetical protein [Lentibacillus sp. CBA3610]QKY69962.1 hypothetical protein Len3610_10505 [Lentibacillus sp. CBA3610]